MTIQPPQSENELTQRAQALAGMPLSSLASQLQWPVPDNLKREKGWVGQLIETALGATAGTASIPDFHHLGIELKTIPLTAKFKPRESTYVCTVPLHQVGLNWQDSCVARKLAHVLWVPVEGEPDLPVANRRIGMPFLWRPSLDEEQLLRNDWEELMEQVALGDVEQITAHQGEALQIRPKAANSRVTTQGINSQGRVADTLPRGFYLRPTFTHQLLLSHS